MLARARFRSLVGSPLAVALATYLMACSSTTNVTEVVAPSADAAADGAAGGDGGSAGGSSDASASDSAPGFPEGTGPGIYGALPSGYCCATDADCKDRHCVDVGGGMRTCENLCTSDSDCDVPKTPFTCTPDSDPTARHCVPPSGVSCVPASQFVRGTKPFGACCIFANGQAGGADCESHVCDTFSGGPDICTSHCATQNDCPSDYKCELNGGANAVPTCIPLAVYSNGKYTCD